MHCFNNTSEKAIDILIFGGEEYTEPIVAEGPFVMNSLEEIADATGIFMPESMVKSTKKN
ncbi:MAG: pirin-like C-terminal cupin domain-containing protein [Flavobacterium sp.]